MTYEEILCDANNLYRAYKASIKGSKWKESTQVYMLNHLRNIFKIQDNLINRTLQNSPTSTFVLRERGRIRPITSYHTSDRIIRHILCDAILLPEVQKRIIYDNGASITGRGISHSRKRFEIHLKKYYKEHGNDGYILFGDFQKFYDNIVHSIAKKQLLDLVNNDEFVSWLLDVIFDGFKIDVSYMSEYEHSQCLRTKFNKLEYRKIPSSELTGEKYMYKSVNIGDQLSQIIGIYYPHRIDNYVKYVRSQKYYGRYMDDWYIINRSKEELNDILDNIRAICTELGIHLNEKKTRIVKLDSTFKYLQIKYNLTPSGKIVKRINPKRLTDMRRKLKKLSEKVNRGESDYNQVEEMFRSWMGDSYKLMSALQRSNMLILYNELFNKRIEIIDKKMHFYNS